MRTLHAYIGKELLKTFLMTWVTLTAVVVMGGGVANLFRGEGVAPRDVAKVFFLLVPVMATIILPVAALFSAAITYGRASADNEILACRAVGINIFRILLVALLLGLFVSGITYYSWNYMIPTLSAQQESLTRRGFAALVMGQFQRSKALNFGKYTIQADKSELLEGDRAPQGAVAEHSYIWLQGVTFLEMADEQPVRLGTADETVIDFDQSEDPVIHAQRSRVRADLKGVRTFDVGRRQYYELEHQVLGPYDLPMRMKWKIKFQDLPTLQSYVRDPMLMPVMMDLMGKLRRDLMEQFLFQDVVAAVDQKGGGSGKYELIGKESKYEIAADQYAVHPEDGQPTLREVRVIEQGRDGMRIMRAGRAVFDVKSSPDPERPWVTVELSEGVQITRQPAQRDDRPIQSPKESLAPVDYYGQPRLAARMKALDFAALLDPEPPITLTPKLKKGHENMLKWLQRLESKVQGEIHFRASYAASAAAVVLLAAVLGIIMRGAQVLTAFGISCIPTAVVVLSSMLGRNLADRPESQLTGLYVMWGATALMYLAMTLVTTRFLKR